MRTFILALVLALSVLVCSSTTEAETMFVETEWGIISVTTVQNIDEGGSNLLSLLFIRDGIVCADIGVETFEGGIGQIGRSGVPGECL